MIKLNFAASQHQSSLFFSLALLQVLERGHSPKIIDLICSVVLFVEIPRLSSAKQYLSKLMIFTVVLKNCQFSSRSLVVSLLSSISRLYGAGNCWLRAPFKDETN